MTSAFTLLRALLAVLWLSTGVCAAECAALPPAPASPVLAMQTGDPSPVHCAAHCEDHTSLSGAHRVEKSLAVLPAGTPVLKPNVPPVGDGLVRTLSVEPIVPRLRQGLDDLKTIRLLI